MPTYFWYLFKQLFVLEKLEQGAIDDEIWGKIIIMERGKRIAKAYLRKTTIIVDGGEDEFDGKTLGFNHFSNPQRDEYTEEFRSKIGDGVIIKMDNQGNIKAMARGSTPVIVQGWKEPNSNCISERLLREQGKLKTKERIAKIFDMRRFKSAISRELVQPDPDARELLMKTCVRVSLVKDCSSDPMKTPCWFMIINLVALDMLKTKLPQVLRNCKLCSTIIPSATAAEVYSQAALSQIIAAAVQQANTQLVNSLN
ncbi:unnamed protein product [Enterobius vermicularis]|uniref:MH2 domain-containing protein n=1 Tax=Enterobius vermicularis TaxID=51028 RepID=A0A3P6IGI7_ENTVE|nr:unnamed protein product [Enterobius vermicularis]